MLFREPPKTTETPEPSIEQLEKIVRARQAWRTEASRLGMKFEGEGT